MTPKQKLERIEKLKFSMLASMWDFGSEIEEIEDKINEIIDRLNNITNSEDR